MIPCKRSCQKECIFNSGYEDAFSLLLLLNAFRSEEEVLWRRGPSLTYFCAALDPPQDGSGRKV